MIRPVSQAEDPGSATIDYGALTLQDARALMGATNLPRDLRIKVLEHYAAAHGYAATLALFADFMAMANSVVANARELLELELITTHGYTDRAAEKINLPTIFGALQGVVLAEQVSQDLTCGGCAFRRGTPANQSPVTTSDADFCAHLGEPDFYCHLDLDERDQPTKGCAGFAQLRAHRKREMAHGG